jgi:hypothetical protein
MDQNWLYTDKLTETLKNNGNVTDWFWQTNALGDIDPMVSYATCDDGSGLFDLDADVRGISPSPRMFDGTARLSRKMDTGLGPSEVLYTARGS